MSDDRKVSMAQSVKELREMMPAMLEHAELMARLWKAKFDHLKAAGFTDEQALQLCWRS